MSEFQNFRATPFSVLRASAQAEQLGTLVRNNAEWLQDTVYSGVIDRFGRQAPLGPAPEVHIQERGKLSDLLPPKVNAMRHIARMVMFHPTLHSYILEAQPASEPAETVAWQTVGLGTVTRGVNAVLDGHPNFPSYRLTDVDYWLDADAESTALHGVAARTMVEQARRRVCQHENSDTVHLIASIVPSIRHGRDMGPSTHQPVGFTEVMYPPEHRLAVPISVIGEDPYGIAKGSRNLSVWTLKVPATGPLEL